MSSPRVDGFAPLNAYALLGDLRAAALVADDGAVDWLALPTLDSPPVCAALLDPENGGSLTLAPTVPSEVERRYLPGTMVLETTFTTARGTVRITDALTLGALRELPWTELARVVDVLEGEVPLAWEIRPGHCLARHARPWAHVRCGCPTLLVGDHQLAVVLDGLGAARVEHDRIVGEQVVRAGGHALLALVGTRGEPLHIPAPDAIRERVARTAQTWRRWSDPIPDHGRWHDAVVRSALMLKALTLAPTGAIAGAATSSLPEKIGGERNFDYRFAWIRDASFALDAMSRLGRSEEVHAGVVWMLEAIAPQAPGLRVFYDLHGNPTSAEMTQLQDLPGYQGSLPVNVGNGAADQMQLGAYGDLFDAVHLYTEHGGIISPGHRTMLAGLADHVCEMWTLPDAGLWELSPPQQYTSSKHGSWVALDRAVRLGEGGQIDGAHVPRWRLERDRVRAWIDERCWSSRRRAYTFCAGSEKLDAALLLMARTGFCEPGDPRLGSTIDAILEELTVGPFVYRYSGQRDQEGAFLACTCWLVEALVHAGRAPEAERTFSAFLECAGDAGLFTEEIDPPTGELLGNIPQALTHLAVIGAATALRSVG
jgi:GH15 family glucan-1,4-alpha-glucosidase